MDVSTLFFRSLFSLESGDTICATFFPMFMCSAPKIAFDFPSAQKVLPHPIFLGNFLPVRGLKSSTSAQEAFLSWFCANRVPIDAAEANKHVGVLLPSQRSPWR